MPVYKIVFSNQAVNEHSPQHAPHQFVFRINASSKDEAIGLAQIEFTHKQPQLAHADYRPQVQEDSGDDAQRVHSFEPAKTFNPDK